MSLIHTSLVCAAPFQQIMTITDVDVKNKMIPQQSFDKICEQYFCHDAESIQRCDIKNHNHLVEVLEELGIPIAYHEFEDEIPQQPYILFETKIKEKCDSSRASCKDQYIIDLYVTEKDYRCLQEKTENTLQRSGYQIEKYLCLMNIRPNEHKASYFVIGPCPKYVKRMRVCA